jgi:Tol biopolymer transport system component
MEPPANPAGEKLESWKQIACYLKRDVRTVQRWEKREGLPVHRHAHDKLGSIYAFTGEIDAWSESRRLRNGKKESKGDGNSRRLWLISLIAIASAAALVVWLVAGGSSAETSEIAARRVWSGPDVDRLGGVSPDGRHVAYMDKAADALAIREIAGGRERPLFSAKHATHAGEAANPLFSPGGSQLAFAWFNEEEFWDLRVINADGSGHRIVSRDPGVARMMPCGWSDSGEDVLVIRTRQDGTGQLALVSASGGGERIIKTFEGWSTPIRARHSPAAALAAYDRPVSKGDSAQDLFMIDSAPGQAAGREIPLVVHPADDYLLGWAPDGRSLYFASDRSGDIDVWKIRVTPQGPAGGPVRVMRNIGRAWPLGFASNGSFYYGLQTGLTDVYTAGLDSGGLRFNAAPVAAAPRFVGANRSPDWSPGGQEIAWASQIIPFYGRFGVRVMIKTLATGAVRVLAPAATMVEHFRWSPDGALFLSTGLGPDGLAALFTIDATNGAVAVLRRGGSKEILCEPAWHPGGAAVYFKARHGGTEPAPLIAFDLAARAEKQLLPAVYRYDVSPDGRRLAYSSFDSQSEYLRILPLAGGLPREVYRQPRGSGRIYSIAWTRDGRHLLFSRRGELWRIPAAGGAAEKLDSPAVEGLREIRVHPGGRSLAFTGHTGRGEVWVVENLLHAP